MSTQLWREPVPRGWGLLGTLGGMRERSPPPCVPLCLERASPSASMPATPDKGLPYANPQGLGIPGLRADEWPPQGILGAEILGQVCSGAKGGS